MDELLKYLPILLPILLLQVGLMIFALLDLRKMGTPKHLDKKIWIIVIVFVSWFGPIAYFLIGRGEYRDDRFEDE